MGSYKGSMQSICNDCNSNIGGGSYSLPLLAMRSIPELIAAGMVPHRGKRTVLCFDLTDTDTTVRAIERIASKYPLPFMLAMDTNTYRVLYDMSDTVDIFAMTHTYRPISACLEIYDVIGILCGSDRAFPDVDRRVMRC